MLKDIKNTLKQSAIYGLSRISIKFIAFILFPLYSLHFSVDEYGIIVRGEIFWQILQTFMLYAIETAVIRWYSIIEDTNKKKSLILSVFLFLLFLNLVFIISSLIFHTQISYILFDSQIYSRIVITCSTIAMLETLIGIPLVILRINEKALQYASIVIIETLISLGLQVYFIKNTSFKIDGIFISKAIAPFITFLVLLPVLIKSINLHFDFKILKEILSFCFPLMFASLVSSLFVNQNRFILGYLTDSREVGLFGLGNNVAGILIFLFISPFALTFPQIFWKKINDSNASRFFTKSMTYSYFTLVYSALILSIISPHFIKLFARNPDYWYATPIVPFISFSLVFYGMQVIGFMSFYYNKKTSIVLIVLIISAIVNIFLNILLIPQFKMYGAAISTYLSYLISTIIMYFLSKKYYFIEWENYKLFISMFLAIFLTSIYYLLNINNLFFSISLGFIIIILYPILLYYFKFYEEIEIITVSGFLKKIFSWKKINLKN